MRGLWIGSDRFDGIEIRSVLEQITMGKKIGLTQNLMDSLSSDLDLKLRQWRPDIAQQVRQYIAEIMQLADQDSLDILRSKLVEQDVLDLLDEP